jgi:uncharacterized membrane protein YhhN
VRPLTHEHAVLAVAAAATVFGAVAERPRVQQVAKPLIATALAVRVARQWRREGLEASDAVPLLLGLGAAAVGDVFMLDPDDDSRILRGASCFAVMQASYSWLLGRHGARARPAAVLPRVAASGAVAALLAARAPEIAAPLAAYGVTLVRTSTLSADPALSPASPLIAGFPVPSPADPRSWLAAGGMVFALSDGMIAVRRTLLRGEHARRLTEGVILATYALAQVMIVEGILAVARKK